MIKASEANKQQRINEAEGQAAAILAVARATAEGIRSVAKSIQAEGGFEAVQLRVAEQYLTQFGQLAKTGNTPDHPVEPRRRRLGDRHRHERDPGKTSRADRPPACPRAEALPAPDAFSRGTPKGARARRAASGRRARSSACCARLPYN